jgi:hypothetical protein
VLADDAVLIGPVSTSNSLQQGNQQGILSISTGFWDFGIQSASKFNPLQPNSRRDEQGIAFTEQGIFWSEHGHLRQEQAANAPARNPRRCPLDRTYFPCSFSS